MNNKNLLFGFSAAIVLGIAFVFASFVGIQKYMPIQNNYYSASVPTSQSVYDNSTTPLLNSTFLGPSNLGGRFRALLIDKNNANVVFAGSCGGGLWKTSTGGTSWTCVIGFADNLIVTSITQSSNGDIYVATGEGFSPTDADMIGYKGFIGKGIYKSSDGGNTFSQISSTNPGNGNDPNTEWAYINDLVCDQATNKLYAATNKGLRVSINGGDSWSNPIPSFTSIAYQVSCVGNTVVVGFDTKCFVSTDGGNNFSDQSTGAADKLPSTGVVGMSIVVAPSNSNYIYASLARTDGQLLNVYRSIDAGSTWSVIGFGGTTTFSPLGNHGWYNNIISVFPNDENKIIVGGANLWMWDNGGNWIQKSVSNNNYAGYSAYYVPNAQHRVVFHPVNNNIFYIATDRGISRTIDGGETFRLMYIGTAATSFYSAALGYHDLVIGGTQGMGVVSLGIGLPSPQNTYGFSIPFNSISGGTVATSFIIYNKATTFATTLDGGILRAADDNYTWLDVISARMGTPKFHSLVPFSYWESLNDATTVDTIAFVNGRKQQNLKNGDGATKLYHDTIIPDQEYAKIVPTSIEITTGTQTVVDDGLGKLRNITISGEELGTINYTSGEINFSFKNAPGYGAIVGLKFNVRYNAGDVIVVKSYIDNYPFNHTLTSNLEALHTIYVKDVVQSKLFLGASNAVWMTRKALDFTKPPHWFNVAKFADITDSIKSISNTKNGDCIFYGTKKGKLFRASNILHAQDSITGDTTSLTNVIIRKDLTTQFNQADRVITAIAIDPADGNHIVITLGNYNKTNYIYESRNALGANPTFQLKQGNLPAMPIYSAIIEMTHPNFVIIGTENGLYYTEDISAANPVWVDHSATGSFPHVPVFSLRQQILDFPMTSYIITGKIIGPEGNQKRYDTIVNTTGKIIIGTFGRGVYENNTFKVPNEVIEVPLSSKKSTVVNNSNLNIYPNPAINQTKVYFNLAEKSNIEMIVMDVQGRIIKKININGMEGYQEYFIDCKNLKNGTYYVQVITSKDKMTGKFVVVK